MSERINQLFAQNSSLLLILLLVNVVLIIIAPLIVKSFFKKNGSDEAEDFYTNVIRGLNVLAIGLLGYFRFYGAGQYGQNIGIKLLSILVIIYLSYLATHLSGSFVRSRYGRKVQSTDGQRIADTYASRALAIFISAFIAIMALISIIRVAGFGSVLEAGGVIGFIGVFLALTQSAWAPDVISGLVILNTKMFSERDVIKLTESGESTFAVVYRTLAFHTVLLDMVDNHRIMIRNSKIRDYTVHNLSRFASARGLRETLKFKIGYDIPPSDVHKLFEKVFAKVCENHDIAIEAQHPVEIRLQDTGDHAVEWSVHYYTKDEHSLLKTRQYFMETALQVSLEEGISLSTPVTHQSV